MARPPCRPAREAGFTIVEVLAAFVVFGLAFAGVMQLFTSGLRDAQLADEYARAVMIAQSRLATFTASEKMEEGAGAGVETPFAWSLTALPYDDRQEDPASAAQGEYRLAVRLLRVESRVSWAAADGRDREVRLATLVLARQP